MIGEQLNGAYVSYLRGANLISRTSEDGTDFYLFNAHGDVTGLADSTGASTRAYDYDAFGVVKDPDPLDENPFRYCGEYFDRETETYYLARDITIRPLAASHSRIPTGRRPTASTAIIPRRSTSARISWD